MKPSVKNALKILRKIQEEAQLRYHEQASMSWCIDIIEEELGDEHKIEDELFI